MTKFVILSERLLRVSAPCIFAGNSESQGKIQLQQTTSRVCSTKRNSIRDWFSARCYFYRPISGSHQQQTTSRGCSPKGNSIHDWFSATCYYFGRPISGSQREIQLLQTTSRLVSVCLWQFVHVCASLMHLYISQFLELILGQQKFISHIFELYKDAAYVSSQVTTSADGGTAVGFRMYLRDFDTVPHRPMLGSMCKLLWFFWQIIFYCFFSFSHHIKTHCWDTCRQNCYNKNQSCNSKLVKTRKYIILASEPIYYAPDMK